MGQRESWVGHARARRSLNADRALSAVSAFGWVGACLTVFAGTACSSFTTEEGAPAGDLADVGVVEDVARLEQAQIGAALEPAPGSLRLLTKKQYLRTVEMLLGSAARSAAEPLAWAGPLGEAFAASAAVRRSVPSSGTVVAIGAAAEAAARVAVANRADTTQPLASVDSCTTGPAPSNANERVQCYQRVAGSLGRVAFRLPLQMEQVNTLVDIAEEAEAAPEGTQSAFDSGLQQLISAILQGPGLMYSAEVGDSTLPTPRPLLPHELMTRLSLGLLGRAPSLEQLEEAALGGLSTPAQIKAVAQSMLATTEAQEAYWDTFAEWFLLDNFANATRPSFPNFTAQLKSDMMEEAKRFAVDHVFGPSPLPFPQIFSSQRRFITPLLASEIYTQSPISVPAGWSQIDFNSHHDQRRSGVLTLPAFLTVLASDKQTKIIARGKYTWERVMCGFIINLPPGGVGAVPVPPNPPDNVTTWRKLFEQHSSGGCAACHQYFDAGGFSLEHFDQIGAYRETDPGGGNGPINALAEVWNPRTDVKTTILDGLDYGKLIADPAFPGSDQFIENTAHCQMTQLHESLVGEPMQQEMFGSGMQLTPTAEFDAIKANLPGYPQYMLTDFLTELVASPYFTTVGDSR